MGFARAQPILRAAENSLSEAADPLAWLSYLVGVKDVLGNLNNDISFVAGLLVKPYLRNRFGVEFDFALKPQGAPGLDIDITTANGLRIVAEIKTTRPYQRGFGAKQKEEFRKNLDRLAVTVAAHRFMFVTDSESFRTVCGRTLASRAPGIEIVNIVTEESYICPAV